MTLKAIVCEIEERKQILINANSAADHIRPKSFLGYVLVTCYDPLSDLVTLLYVCN